MNGEINSQKNKRNLFIVLIILFIILISIGFYIPNNLSFSQRSIFKNNDSHLKVLVVGDIMLDRNVRNLINKNGFDSFFSGVKDLIKNADIAVGNLEGAFTTNPSITADLKNKALQFTFDPSLAPALSDLGFDILGLANNHSYNYGKQGLESTRRYIGSAGMLYYGDPFNKDEISTIIIKNGIKIGFIGFHEFHYTNFENVLYEITKLKSEVDVIIVSPHWGIEYQKNPTTKMKEWAHQFIDNGADMVIGAHPHIVGDTEIYNGKKIYYSLGNFAFDQYFSEATMNGIAVLINIDRKDDKISFTFEDILVRVDREGVKVINK